MNDRILHPTADRLQAFIEGTLAEGDRAVVDSHVLGCAVCQGEVEEWRSLFAMLATLPQHEPSPHFADLVMSGVKLPDPWYHRAAAYVGAQLQVFTPRTTRGWAFATACMSLPIALFGALTMWILSQPGITPDTLLSFAYDRAHNFVSGQASSAMAGMLQGDVGFLIARGFELLSKAGLGTAGALAVGIAMMIALSAWFLYQNLFRTSETREENDYGSYCF